MTEDILQKNVASIKGVGKRRQEALKSLEISTLGDVLFYFPRTYRDLSVSTPISDINNGQTAVVHAKVTSDIKEKKTSKGLSIFSLTVNDGSASMEIILFNQEFIAKKLLKNEKYIFYGKVNVFGRFKDMESPQIESADKACILPIYALTKGVTQKMIRNITDITLKQCLPAITDSLPSQTIKEFNLLSLHEAYLNIHFPKSDELAQKARERLVFEEFLQFSLGTAAIKRRGAKNSGYALRKDIIIQNFFDNLPYKLTSAQDRVLNECLSDMSKSVPMARIIQGDVGSGKTVVAAALMYYTSKNGYQSCLMAPTEILSIQHFNNLTQFYSGLDVKCAILTSSTPKIERTKLLWALEKGEIDVLIGTHSVLNEKVKFKDLALTITDEQHRFGVVQRSVLTEKGIYPHKLIMSATPIPRTLALIMYGDLDISVIDELPPGRQKISTFLVNTSYHIKMYTYLREQIRLGAQAYVVCPLVEDNENDSVKSAIDYAKELTQVVLRGVEVRYLYGKMPSKEKELILKEFSDGTIKVLVSTTVIEVGVDVPNATIMIIENAERFGLSQLHQLRGRVGRGSKKSYCFLSSDIQDGNARKRMDAFCKMNNGFDISQADLEIRGPGEFLGSRQSGDDTFKVANLARDIEILKKAQNYSAKLWKDNPTWFNEEQYLPLKNAVNKMFANTCFNILS